jgi:hypothetical protein
MRASFALGAAVAANLTFAIPAVALVLVFLHLEKWELGRLRFWDAVNQLILPGTVASAVLLLLPLIKASRDAFYFGAKSISDSIDSLTFPALVHHTNRLINFGRWMEALAPVFLGGAAVLILAAILSAARGGPGTFARRMPVLLTGGTLALSCALLVTAHTAAGLLYPAGRTGLYLVVLFTLAVGSLAVPYGATARGAAVGLAAPILILFATQLTAGPYHAWVFDSGSKAIVKLILSDMRGTGKKEIHIAAGHYLQPTLNFYRRRFHLNAVARVTEDSFDHPADYYVLIPEEEALVKKKRLEVMYRDPASLQILAKPQVIH